MAEKEVMLDVKDLTKSFKVPTEKASGMKQALLNVFKGVKGFRKFEVLKGINFQVERGDFFGIVGRNGAGKSTTLKLISQIYTPDSGSVEIHGSLVPFIELGVGFNPELTGRENIYMNGALLGFSEAEVDQMYDDIVEFAELHDFMDQKLKNYSSGMQVRLAFSIAIKADADILVLDEVLAVGDEAFQRKCNNYFKRLKSAKKTVVLVTHSMDAVKQFCNKAILINEGQIVAQGNPEEVANEYSLLNLQENVFNESENGLGTEPTKTPIKDLELRLLSGSSIDSDSELRFVVEYENEDDFDTYVAFSLLDPDVKFNMIYNDNTMDTPCRGRGKHRCVYSVKLPMLNQRIYTLSAVVRNMEHENISFFPNNKVSFTYTRDDVKSEREKDAAYGLISNQGGVWEVD
ncbi:MAG: ABC transporter ATP-binding protein [Candidatus Ancillula sp.]|jgi:ABC-2 type transport system ATP-binding protein|nr:ABC transporter ATP-binding protein [Candidatus Ancillula sp.]